MIIEDWDGTPIGEDVEALRVAPGWTFLDLAGTLLAHACDGDLLLRLPPGWSSVAAEPDRAVLRSGELVLTATHAALHGSRAEVSRHLERLARDAFAGEPELRRPDTGNICFRGRAAGPSRVLRWVIWTAEGDQDAGRLATIDLAGPWAGSPGSGPANGAGDREADGQAGGVDRLLMLIEHAEFPPSWASAEERAGETLPWKTIAVEGAVALRIPTAWVHAPLAEGGWFAGNQEGPPFVLRLRTERLGPLRTQTREDRRNALRNLDPRRIGPGWRRVRVQQGADDRLLRFERRSADGLAHQWVALVHADEAGTTCLYVHLSAAGAAESDPAVTRIVEQLDRELSHARLLPRPDLGITRGRRAPDDEDPFAPLKSITAFDRIRLRVPAIWRCAWDEKAGMWCCCQDDQDTGTLWIGYDHFVVEPEDVSHATRSAAEFARKLSHRLSERESAAVQGAEALSVAELPDGSVRYIQHDGEDAEGPLRFHRWDRAAAIGRSVVHAYLSLVFSAATADRPAWRRLVETIDREVRAADFLSGGDRP